MIISPEMYRQIKPCHQGVYEFIHSKTNAKGFMHTDGAICDMLHDLIEIGVDILNLIQSYTREMSIDRLKKQFGSDLC